MGGTRKKIEVHGMKTDIYHAYIYIYSICHEVTGTIHCLGDVEKNVAHSRAKPNATGFMLSPFNFQLAKTQVSKKTCHQNQHMEKSHSVSLLGLLADTLGRWFCTICRRSLGPKGV